MREDGAVVGAVLPLLEREALHVQQTEEQLAHLVGHRIVHTLQADQVSVGWLVLAGSRAGV